MKNGPCPRKGRRTGVVPPSFRAVRLYLAEVALSAIQCVGAEVLRFTQHDTGGELPARGGR